MKTEIGSPQDPNPDIVDLRDVIDCIREWGGRLEVGHFSTGKRYVVETSKLGMSSGNFKELCRQFVREAAKIKAGVAS